MARTEESRDVTSSAKGLTCDTKAISRAFDHNCHRRKFPAKDMDNARSSLRPPHRPKCTRAFGGPGMQAIFLDSSTQKSCGTGVFIPQNASRDTNRGKNRQACSPVLLPSRVVQALNLNVHALGLQILPRQDATSTRKGGDHRSKSSMGNKKLAKKDVSPSRQCSVGSQRRRSLPELFLPKEWTY